MKYAVVFEKSANNYAAFVPDLPGCVATGKTRRTVEKNIREAIAFHIEGFEKTAILYLNRKPGLNWLTPRLVRLVDHPPPRPRNRLRLHDSRLDRPRYRRGRRPHRHARSLRPHRTPRLPLRGVPRRRPSSARTHSGLADDDEAHTAQERAVDRARVAVARRDAVSAARHATTSPRAR